MIMKKLVAIMTCMAIFCSIGATAVAAMDVTHYQNYFLAYGELVSEAEIAGNVIQPDWLIGDMNFDGQVTAEDALNVLHYSLLDPETFSFENHGSNTPKQYYYGYVDEIYKNGIVRDIETGQYKYAGRELYFTIFFYNSAIVADVNNDSLHSSVDALMILQYVVGKRTEFPRTDYQWPREKLMFFIWPENYTSGMFWKNRNAEVWPPIAE